MSCINSTTVNVLNNDQIIATTAANEHLSEVKINPPARLKAKPSSCKGIWALPFTTDSRRKSNTPYWVVPATGGYSNGYEIGVLMANSYLKLLRMEPNNGCISYLGLISESIESRTKGVYREDLKSYEQSNEYDSLKGQKVGFFNTLDQWLSFAAKNAGGRLDELTNKDLIKQVNAYL